MNKLKSLGVLFLERKIKGVNYNAVAASGKISKNIVMRGSSIAGNVHIDEGCKIIDGVSLKTASKITVGRFTSINGPNTDLFSQINEIKVGSFCSIARSVTIQEFNHNFKSITSYAILQNIFGHSKKDDIYSNGDIEIGHDVWIAAQCVILSGSKIGNGAVIAANSVVNSEIPNFAIAAGTPAKVIGYRFKEEVIKKLEEIKWWEWPLEKIKRNKELFVGDLTLEKIAQIKD